ncbi:hypothetical protein PRIPAC_95126, partial [Pristionchus pacificus]
QRLRSFNWLYLTDDRPAIYGLNIWALPKQDYLQDWTIERLNDNEVVIKSNRVAGNFFIAHNMEDEKYNYAKEARVANNQQPSAILTPVKNPNGSWSFKSRGNKWLSGHAYYEYYDPKRYYVNFQPANMNCEHWFLEPYTPPSPPTIMDELLANGGKRQFKSYNGMYLTDDHPSSYIWAFAKDGTMNTKQDWTIVQMNNNKVAIKSNDHGFFIGHGGGGWAKPAVVPDEWEMLTPVKNDDGTWSFHSRWNGWLSAHTLYERDRYYVNFETNNWRCERWKLEMYLS